jgi:hypothetical protein
MIQQMDLRTFESDLLPQAVLGRAPEYFEKRLGIKFLEDYDDLDYYKGVLLSLDDSTIFALKQYRGNDPKTTIVYLKSDQRDIDQITKIVGIIVNELGLQSDDIIWQRRDNPEA